MKMEHTISAPRAGTVKSFRYAPGDQVAEGVELVEFSRPPPGHGRNAVSEHGL
jgi:3-methylcrotonyl-CoA carboxylase alpha subunit